MSDDSVEWIERMRAIEREHAAIRQAVDRLRDLARAGPTILLGDVTPRDLDHASGALEGTFVVRLYAEFEAGLRQYWARGRDTSPRMEQLLDSIASSSGLTNDDRARLPEVRIYRNSLVHEQDESIRAIPIGDARHRLCTLFGRLPRRWPSKRT